jgi:hypothetical protein
MERDGYRARRLLLDAFTLRPSIAPLDAVLSPVAVPYYEFGRLQVGH